MTLAICAGRVASDRLVLSVVGVGRVASDRGLFCVAHAAKRGIGPQVTGLSGLRG